jgi:hypothetical protein
MRRAVVANEMIGICSWGPRDDPGPGPPEPRLDPARAGSPAARAVPLNSRGVSCPPNGDVKGKTGRHRSTMDGRRGDPGDLRL